MDGSQYNQLQFSLDCRRIAMAMGRCMVNNIPPHYVFWGKGLKIIAGSDKNIVLLYKGCTYYPSNVDNSSFLSMPDIIKHLILHLVCDVEFSYPMTYIPPKMVK